MKEGNYTIPVRDALTLSHIFDFFETFNSNLSAFLSKKTRRNSIHELEKLILGKSKFASKEVKKFYQENQFVLQKIKEFSDIHTFFAYYYNNDGMLMPKLSVFYQYLLNNKEKKEQIFSLIEKINTLGIKDLEFNENLDFTKEEYIVYLKTPLAFGLINMGYDMVYVDHMKAIPNYERNVIKYKTTDSNYKILLQSVTGKSKIIVNSLLFDSKRLPEEITVKSLYQQLNKLKQDNQEACEKVRNSVDLDISIEDLWNQFNKTENTLESLEFIEDKYLREKLIQIRETLYLLKKMSSDYDFDLIKEGLSKETLEKEKELYLKRRSYEDID